VKFVLPVLRVQELGGDPIPNRALSSESRRAFGMAFLGNQRQTRSANTEHGELQAFMVNLFAFYLWPSRNTLYAIVAADKWVTS